MKNLLCFAFLLLFVHTSVFAQKTITGKVLSTDNTPLEGAAVYLNSTSIGTTTNENGEFELRVKEGNYDLIASYLGFETAQFSLDTKIIHQPIIFKLTPKSNLLNEVVVSGKKNTMSAEDRAYFMSRFKRTFLGKTDLAQECKILNEEVIEFEFDLFSKTLEAYISKPIIIENKGLGYRIYYDLVHFELSPQRVSYLGYTRYENLKGSKRKMKKWKKRRRIAYNGSNMHFLRSIQNETVKQEGFVVDQYIRVPNPNRPSDSIIDLAKKRLRTLVQTHGSMTITLASNRDLNDEAVRNEVIKRAANNKQVQANVDLQSLANQSFEVSKDEKGLYKARTQADINTERDSLNKILKKARLKKYIDKLVKEDLQLSEYSKKSNETYFLSFPKYLKVKYMNEPEEDNYRPGDAKLDYQVSTISLFVESSQIHPTGILLKPLDAFLEGYWSYERIADSLPLDYDPTN
jgi:hypothetical protein